MTTLSEILLADGARGAVIDDCVHLVDSEVAAKSGLGGIAVKGAYGLVKKLKPGIIREAVDRLLNDFVGALDPFYTAAQQQGSTDLTAYFDERRADVAEALLAITDRRIAGAKNKTIKKAYGKLRPTGVKHVQAAVPGIGRVIAQHT